MARSTSAPVITPWVTPTQALAAGSTLGACRLIPAALIISIVSCPWALGSGKLGRPCLRRHRANASSARACACCWAGLSLWGPGRRCWQACWAALNWGDWLALPTALMLIFVWPGLVVTCGSGKFVAPWVRMHREKANAAAAGPCEAPPPLVAPPVVVDGPVDPQPATAAQTAAHASIDRRVVRMTLLLVDAGEPAKF